jgi:hypothetical protein
LVALFVLLGGAAGAQDDVAVFEQLGDKLVLTPKVRWILEEGGPLTPQLAARALESAPMYGGDGEWMDLGMMNAVVWMAVTIRNDTDDEHLIFEFRNPRMNFVDFYFPDGAGGYTTTWSGVSRPFNVRPYYYAMPAFPMVLEKGESATVLLRLDNNGDYRQRIWLWDSVAFTNHVATAYLSDMMTLGVFVVLLVFQFLVFVSLRERSYLYLCFFVLSWLLFLMAGTGMGKMMLWQDLPWLTMRASSLFMIMMMATFTMFTLAYLDSRKLTPRLYRLGLLHLGVCVAHLVYTSVLDNYFRMELNRLLVIATFVVVMTLSIGALRAGSRTARFFILSWAFMITGGLLMLLLSWYAPTASFVLGTPLISMLFGTSILLWSLELIGRVKVRAREQQQLLEVQVKERTRELEQALSEVNTLSGLLPMCSHCKKIRDDTGYWSSVEHYIGQRTGADFTHGICPDCIGEHFPEFAERKQRRAQESGGAQA